MGNADTAPGEVEPITGSDSADAENTDAGDERLNKRYENLRSMTDRVGTENARLRQELAEMKGQMSVLMGDRRQSEQPPQEDPFASWDSPEFKEELDATPSKIIEPLKQTIQKLASAIIERDRIIESRFGSVQGEIKNQFERYSISPELEKYKDEMATLRRDEDFAGLSDRALLKVVKARHGDDSVSPPPGLPSGRSSQNGSSVKITKESQPRAWSLALELGDNDPAKAEKIFNNMIRRTKGA